MTMMQNRSDIIFFLNEQVRFVTKVDSNVVFTVEKPDKKERGDFATNIAMSYAKIFKKNPLEIAKVFCENISTLDFVKSCEVAPPGFINFFIKEEFLVQKITDIDENFGFQNFGNGEKINIEFVSANPTGPLHIGHVRGAIFGDVLSQLLVKNGFDVCREYYINDGGGQIATLVKSFYIRYLQVKGEDVQIPDGCYPGLYLLDFAKVFYEKFGPNIMEDDIILEEFIVSSIMDGIKADLRKIGIFHDIFTSEKEIKKSGEIEKALKILEDKNLIYTGFLPEPKGRKAENWKPTELLLFRSTNFGDTEDRAVKKPDGSYTYFVPDIAYSKNKIDRGFSKMVLVLGADHLGFLTRVRAATMAIAPNPEDISWKALLCQIVRFVENGEPVRMSKRKGTFTTLEDVLDFVHKDILRFVMISKKNDAPLDFDFVKVKEQTKDNPVFYIQYSYSRASSVCKKAEGIDISLPNLSLLKLPEEIDLVKKMLELPHIMKICVSRFEPHHLAFYLYDLASDFHRLWSVGNDDKYARFIVDDNPDLTAARIFLINKYMQVVRNVFSVLKIEPIEQM